MNKKILCIDYGTKNIGLAISDNTATIGFIYKTLKQSVNLVNQILEVISTENIKTILIGQNLHNNKDLNTDNFIQQLKKHTNINIVLFNEDFSTYEAIEKINTANKKVKEKLRLKDAVAAQIILQKYIESQNDNGSRNGN